MVKNLLLCYKFDKFQKQFLFLFRHNERAFMILVHKIDTNAPFFCPDKIKIFLGKYFFPRIKSSYMLVRRMENEFLAVEYFDFVQNKNDLRLN